MLRPQTTVTVAQSVERWIVASVVVGSSPIGHPKHPLRPFVSHEWPQGFYLFVMGIEAAISCRRPGIVG